MSGLIHQEALKRSKHWQDVVPFTAADAARAMTTRNKRVSVTTATNVLNDMRSNGQITMIGGKWLRASDNRKWLTMKWRDREILES